MEGKPEDKAEPPRFSEPERARVAADLVAYAAEQQRLWGGIDEQTLARYEAGVLKPEERKLVEQALHDHPALRECMEIAQSLDAEWQGTAPVDDPLKRREGKRPRADRTEGSGSGPENHR